MQVVAESGGAAADGAGADDPDVAAAGAAGRLRTAVIRPRVRGDAGLRHQPARLLRPVGLVSVLCFGATLYVLLVSVPASNQRFREITFKIIASLAEGEVKPRVFYQRFPNIDLYVREIPPTGGWNGVFMSDNRSGDGSTIYIARRGRVVIDAQQAIGRDGPRRGNGTYRRSSRQCYDVQASTA